MSAFYYVILTIHILCGSVALLLFWLASIAKKGRKLHVLSGKYYFLFMWLVIFSAIVLSGINLFQHNFQNASYLGFLALLTSDPLWYSKAILKQKNTLNNTFKRIKKLFGFGLFLFGLFLVIYAIFNNFQHGSILLFIFGMIGITGIVDVLKKLPEEIDHQYKMKLHIRGTVLSGMAGHTAFLVFGAKDMIQPTLSENLTMIPWIVPIFIAIIMIKYFNKCYIK